MAYPDDYDTTATLPNDKVNTSPRDDHDDVHNLLSDSVRALEANVGLRATVRLTHADLVEPGTGVWAGGMQGVLAIDAPGVGKAIVVTGGRVYANIFAPYTGDGSSGDSGDFDLWCVDENNAYSHPSTGPYQSATWRNGDLMYLGFTRTYRELGGRGSWGAEGQPIGNAFNTGAIWDAYQTENQPVYLSHYDPTIAAGDPDNYIDVVIEYEIVDVEKVLEFLGDASGAYYAYTSADVSYPPAYSATNGPGDANAASARYLVGTYQGAQGYLLFDTSALAGKTIVSARLDFQLGDTTEFDQDLDFGGDYYDFDVPPVEADLENDPEPTPTAFLVDAADAAVDLAGVEGDYKSIDLLDPDANINKTGITKIRFFFIGEPLDFAGAQVESYLAIAGTAGGGKFPPRLVVTVE